VVIMPPSPVASSLRGWKEKQAARPNGWPIRRQPSLAATLAADGAGGVFDQDQLAALGNRLDFRNTRPACPSGARP